MFAVTFLEPATYFIADPQQGKHLHELDPDDDIVVELLMWAVDELSSTLRLTWDRVVQALLLSDLPVSEECRWTGAERRIGDAVGISADGRGHSGSGYCSSWAESLIEAAGRQGTEASAILYITVEAHVFEPGAPRPDSDATFYLVGIQRRIGSASADVSAYAFAPSLIYAQKVP